MRDILLLAGFLAFSGVFLWIGFHFEMWLYKRSLARDMAALRAAIAEFEDALAADKVQGE